MNDGAPLDTIHLYIFIIINHLSWLNVAIVSDPMFKATVPNFLQMFMAVFKGAFSRPARNALGLNNEGNTCTGKECHTFIVR